MQSSALLLKGQHQFKKPDGTPYGVGHFHFQITATGLDNVNTNSEAELFQKIPDVDTILQPACRRLARCHHNSWDRRNRARNPASNVTRDLNPAQIDYNERRAFVNLNASAKDMELWEAMDKASDELAAVFAHGQKIDIIARNKSIRAQGVDATTYPISCTAPDQELRRPDGE